MINLHETLDIYDKHLLTYNTLLDFWIFIILKLDIYSSNSYDLTCLLYIYTYIYKYNLRDI